MKIAFDPADLRPLISAVVEEVIEKLGDSEKALEGRLGFTEPEAAALIGVEPHVLRDCRLRGEIKATRVGKRLVYARAELLKFITRRN